MFGKFLLTVAVIAIVWFGFRYLARVAEVKRRAAPDPATGPAVQPPDAEMMVECRVCSTWQVASSAKTCGRPGCPY